jgi:hypothetical protein
MDPLVVGNPKPSVCFSSNTVCFSIDGPCLVRGLGCSLHWLRPRPGSAGGRTAPCDRSPAAPPRDTTREYLPGLRAPPEARCGDRGV